MYVLGFITAISVTRSSPAYGISTLDLSKQRGLPTNELDTHICSYQLDMQSVQSLASYETVHDIILVQYVRRSNKTI